MRGASGNGRAQHRLWVAQLLSISSPGITFTDGQEAAQLARRLNEFQAGLVRDHAPRFGSLAILPLPDVEASIIEIDPRARHARHGRDRSP